MRYQIYHSPSFSLYGAGWFDARGNSIISPTDCRSIIILLNVVSNGDYGVKGTLWQPIAVWKARRQVARYCSV